MSVTIYAKQVTPLKGTVLSTKTPTTFLSMMERAFHTSPPFRLDEGDLAVLKGMAATFDETQPNPFQELIQLMHHWKVVDVYTVS